MVEELESVVLTRDIPESGLDEGDVGTVVHRYEGGSSYEVEFVTGEGRTVTVLTLAALAGVRPSIDAPARYESVNVGGTVRLLYSWPPAVRFPATATAPRSATTPMWTTSWRGSWRASGGWSGTPVPSRSSTSATRRRWS